MPAIGAATPTIFAKTASIAGKTGFERGQRFDPTKSDNLRIVGHSEVVPKLLPPGCQVHAKHRPDWGAKAIGAVKPAYPRLAPKRRPRKPLP